MDISAVAEGRLALAGLDRAGGPQAAEGVELLQRQSIGIEADVAGGTVWILPVTLGDLAHAQPGGHGVGQGRHVGRGLRQPFAEDAGQPRSALDRAGPGGGGLLGEHGTESQKTATTIGGDFFYTPPLRPRHAGDAVVLGEDVIDDDRIGGDQVAHRAVVEEQILKKTHRFLGQRVTQSRGELGEVLQATAMVGGEVPHAEPASAKLLRHAARPVVFDHPSDLRLHDPGLVQMRGRRPQFFIRNRVPNQEAQPRGQFIARHRLPARSRRWLLHPVKEPRRREHAGQGGAESGIMLGALGTLGAIACEERFAFIGTQGSTPGPGSESEERIEVAGLGGGPIGEECRIIPLQAFCKSLDEEVHLGLAFLGIQLEQFRIHQRVGGRVFPQEMQFAPETLQLRPARLIEEEPAQRFVLAVEREKAGLGVPRVDRRKEHRRWKKGAKLRRWPGPLGGDARMHDLRDSRFGLAREEWGSGPP